jgi:hypothetical protein
MGVWFYGPFVKKEFRVLNSIKHHTIFETLELNTPGFFYLEERII